MTRKAAQERTTRTSLSNGKRRSARLAMWPTTGAEVAASKPTSSLESPICTPPSSTWRTSELGYFKKGRTRSVTRTWPRLGLTGASNPTIGASTALPRPAARTSLSA